MFFLNLIKRAVINLFIGNFQTHLISHNFNKDNLRNYLENLTNKFIDLNNKSKESCFREDKILIHGTLTNLMNVNFRMGLISQIIKKNKATNIDVLFPGFKYEYSLATQSFNAMGNYNFIFFSLRTLPTILFLFMKSFIVSTKIYFKTYSVQEILSLKYKTILIGDLVYDDILRSYEIPTYKKLDRKYFNVLFFAFFWIYFYNYILSKNFYSYVIISHTVYSEFGILARLACLNGCNVIETSDIHFSIFNAYTEPSEITYHSGLASRIVKSKVKTLPSSHLIDLRFSGFNNQSDIKNALKGRLESKNTILKNLHVKNSRAKNVVVMLHVFDDSPHTSKSMLHLDYYDWFLDTLNIIEESDKVNWFFKAHPSSPLRDIHLITNRINDIHKSNIFLFPPLISSKSIISLADCTLTVQGTAGLEFACFGIPSISTGESFYHDASFTMFCSTREEYINNLRSIDQVQKLNPSQTKEAKIIFNAWSEIFQWNDEILTSQTIMDLRQYEKNCDPNRGLRNLDLQLKKLNLLDYTFTRKIRDLIE